MRVREAEDRVAKVVVEIGGQLEAVGRFEREPEQRPQRPATSSRTAQRRAVELVRSFADLQIDVTREGHRAADRRRPRRVPSSPRRRVTTRRRAAASADGS